MHTYTSNAIHLVFATKDRKRTIDDEIRPRVHAYLGGIAKSIGCIPVSIGGVADHTHGLIVIPARLALADVVKRLKVGSTNWIRDTAPSRRSFEWQRGYGAFSVSRSAWPSVVRYIEAQEAHHRKRTFAEEYVKLLEAHRIEYDPAFLWA
ncbi:MAG: IS200/IS605 family transposase [Acidobacteria bacterium]|nr:IS200/IS605 family transposase [Acidobacteriota bacterium]